MFSSGEYTRPNSRGEYEIAEGFSSAVFHAVLEFYKTGLVHCPPSVSVSELREACDYFLLPFDANIIKCWNLRGLLHELSNEGAKQQFELFLEEHILPLMVSHFTQFCPCILIMHFSAYLIFFFLGFKISDRLS